MSRYEAVIGMEVHAELLTESKMFCGCKNAFGGEPNTRCCPVCMALPGALPVMNRKAVDFVIRTSLALNCEITRNAKFDRKNYFYPDLPKGYQISEYDLPIGVNGWIDVDVDGKTTRVKIRRIHLEEDTGKLQHVMGDESEVDYNRSGLPLMEIVTEFPPDMHTAEEAYAYVTTLRGILTYIGVSDGKMEEGSMRCEPNLSVRLIGSDTYGTKTEIKNLNSFRAVLNGVKYELNRQVMFLDKGGVITQETRGWNDTRQETFSQRSKEGEQEYRYFPEPDLVPLQISEEWIDEIKKAMPELPRQARERFMEQYGLSEYDSNVLTQSRVFANYFEETAQLCDDAKSTANWIMGELSRLMNAEGIEIQQTKVTPKLLADLILLINKGTISGKMAKEMFEKVYAEGADPIALAKDIGPQISDSNAIVGIIDQVIAEQPAIWTALCAGDEKKFGFFVGQIMKASKGKANPQEVNRLLKDKLA